MSLASEQHNVITWGMLRHEVIAPSGGRVLRRKRDPSTISPGPSVLLISTGSHLSAKQDGHPVVRVSSRAGGISCRRSSVLRRRVRTSAADYRRHQHTVQNLHHDVSHHHLRQTKTRTRHSHTGCTRACPSRIPTAPPCDRKPPHPRRTAHFHPPRRIRCATGAAVFLASSRWSDVVALSGP